MSLKKFVLDLPSSDDGSTAQAEAFVFIDLDDASMGSGIVRSAKKILIDGARSLARSETYSWALLGRPDTGASAGINAPDAVRAEAVGAFWSTLGDNVDGIDLRLRPGKGVATSPNRLEDLLLSHGVVAAVTSTLGGLEGRSVDIEEGSPTAGEISRLLTERGATTREVAVDRMTDSEADALVCGSRIGVIDHETAALLGHRAVVPNGPSPLTARAFAVLRSRGVPVIAGFLSACGPLLAPVSPTEPGDVEETGTDLEGLTGSVEEFVNGRCEEFAGHPDGPFMAACYEAERFIGTWRDELPFGRPLG